MEFNNVACPTGCWPATRWELLTGWPYRVDKVFTRMEELTQRLSVRVLHAEVLPQ